MCRNIFEDVSKYVGCASAVELTDREDEVKEALEHIQFTDYRSEDIKEFYQFIFCKHKGGKG